MTIGLAPRGGERLIAAVALWAETALVGLGSILYVTLGIVGDGDDRRLSFGLAGLAAVAAIGDCCRSW